MPSADEPNVPVRAKAVLIDPSAMTIVWLNEAAADDLVGFDPGTAVGARFADALPMPKELGVPEGLAAAVETGVPQHLQADLVSTFRGSMTIVVSIYRLPDGMVLLLSENAWQATERTTGSAGPKRSDRRRR